MSHLRLKRSHKVVAALALTATLSMLSWVALSPQASALEAPVASFDWSMPDRTKPFKPHSSVTDVRIPTPEFITPSSWKVKLDACASTPGSSFRWEIRLPDRVDVVETGQVCAFDYNVPDRGNYQVKLTATDLYGQQATTTKNVKVRDFLIVSMGDSFGSGEGNPEEINGPQTGPYWGDRRCHRSGYSGPAQAALRLERADPHSSVTFLSLACSGAGIMTGLIHEYWGQELAGETTPLDAQILAVSKLLCPGGCASKHDLRTIDALLLQVGANDLHFSKIVYDCAKPRPMTDCGIDLEVGKRLNQDLAALPGRFDALASQLDDWLPIFAVYASEYFDPTRADNGDFCQKMVFDRPGAVNGEILYGEAWWAYHQVVTPLNNEIRAAAQRHSGKNWRFVGGVTAPFQTHGYCSGSRWINTSSDSFAQQTNQDGTMHPNRLGHDAYGTVLTATLRASFKL